MKLIDKIAGIVTLAVLTAGIAYMVYMVNEAQGFTMDGIPIERNATTFCRVVEYKSDTEVIQALQCVLVTDTDPVLEEIVGMYCHDHFGNGIEACHKK